jgi:hypothetical protein
VEAERIQLEILVMKSVNSPLVETAIHSEIVCGRENITFEIIYTGPVQNPRIIIHLQYTRATCGRKKHIGNFKLGG